MRNRMNFDKIIMNPPYNRTLHLNITRKAMEHCDSAVILQPGEFVMNKEWETILCLGQIKGSTIILVYAAMTGK